MKTIIIIIMAAFALTSCGHLAGVKIGACYEDVCVSVTVPQKPVTIDPSGK